MSAIVKKRYDTLSIITFLILKIIKMQKTATIFFLPLFLFTILTCSNFKNKKETSQEELELSKTEKKLSQRYPVYTSSDQGQSWLPLKLNLPKNTQVSFLKDFGNEILIATDNNGLFITTENQSNSLHISADLPDQKINALHVFGNQIYIGVYRQGIFLTENNGKNWTNLNKDLPNLRVQGILKNGDDLIVGTDIGIYKSTKGGAWETTFSDHQIVSLNKANGKIIAGASQGTILSNDEGNTWEWIHQDGAAHSTEIINEEIIIMNVSGDFFRSKDWGKTWDNIFYRLRGQSYIYDVVQSGTSRIFSNNYGIHRSENGGTNWNLIYPREDLAFFDLLIKDNIIYGGTRTWNEWRRRK